MLPFKPSNQLLGDHGEGCPKNYNTYFYEPLETQETIDKSVHWAMGLPNSFVITAGDLQILPKVLDAANRFEKRPSDEEMKAMVDELDMKQIFQPAERCRGEAKDLTHEVVGRLRRFED